MNLGLLSAYSRRLVSYDINSSLLYSGDAASSADLKEERFSTKLAGLGGVGVIGRINVES